MIELLVAMAVVGVLLAAVLTTFVNFLSESSEQAALGKRSTDARLGLGLMRGDLKRIGFGIAEQDLAQTVSGGADRIQFRSTAVHSRGNYLAGVHGVLFNSATGLTVSTRLATAVPNSQWGIVLTPDRERLQRNQLQNVDVAPRNLFFVTRDNNGPDYYYLRRYRLTSSTRPYCASSATNLGTRDANDPGDASYAFGDGDDIYKAIVDCVLDLQFRYGYRMSDGSLSFQSNTTSAPAGADDTYPDVVKVGMILQVGHEYRSEIRTPGTVDYDDPAFTDVDPTGDAEHYRWKTVEWTVPLENMP